jgi:hypothetical protein
VDVALPRIRLNTGGSPPQLYRIVIHLGIALNQSLDLSTEAFKTLG